MVIKTKFVPPGAAAWTVFPFVFVRPDCINNTLIRHEMAHFNQQRRWAICGLGVGLLLWFALYLLVLPVWWNPFREKWEREAFKSGQGLTDEMIDELLVCRPYYLWSVRK